MVSSALNLGDANWDPQDKLAYLEYLLKHGVPCMPENRGKLFDVQHNDRSDLIPVVSDGDLAPLLPETMERTAAYLQTLIDRTRQQIADENLIIETELLRTQFRLP